MNVLWIRNFRQNCYREAGGRYMQQWADGAYAGWTLCVHSPDGSTFLREMKSWSPS